PSALTEFREPIVKYASADILRRGIRERVRAQQRQHGGLSLQEARHEIEEPTVLPVGSERGEPHLPIQAALVRGYERGHAIHVSRLVAELIRSPVQPVPRAFDQDLRAAGRHRGEETVRVDDAKRCHEMENIAAARWQRNGYLLQRYQQTDYADEYSQSY